jgi:ankyrin repeat protein
MQIDDLEGLKAIRTAIKAGETDSVLALIADKPQRLHMDTAFGSWLHVASSVGHLEIVKALVSLGASINHRSGVFGGAPIKEASSGGHLQIVEYLLSHGAELDVSEPERNPLFAAVYGGHLEIVKSLLHAGIDYKIKYTGKSMKNMGAREFALERGQREIASILEKWEKDNA